MSRFIELTFREPSGDVEKLIVNTDKIAGVRRNGKSGARIWLGDQGWHSVLEPYEVMAAAVLAIEVTKLAEMNGWKPSDDAS